MTAEEIKAKLAELEEAAVASFCRNPGWKREYDAAPEGAKRYYRHTFAFSVGTMGCGGREELVKLLAEAFEDEKNDIFRTMDDESWDYVIRNAGGPAKCGLHDVRIHMQGKEGVKMGDWFDDTYERPERCGTELIEQEQVKRRNGIMEETLEELVARCGRMDKAEEETVKRRWLELVPPDIWEMEPEEVVKTAIMLNRNGELRPFDELIPLETIDQIRNYLWDITGMI